MKYIPPYGSPDPDASYVQGDESAGILGSITPAAVFEHPQREILAVVEAAGIVPSTASLTQLRDAISALIAGGVPNLSAYLQKAGGVLTGGGHISDPVDPTADDHLVRKGFLATALAGYVTPGVLVGRRVIDVTSAYVPTAGTKQALVFAQGAGGGGGYGAGSGGGGGGALAFATVDLTSVSSVPVTIGGGGAAAASNATPGSSGGSTSFGLYAVAGGGQGGWGLNTTSSGSPGSNNNGGQGGEASTGDLLLTGAPGEPGAQESSAYAGGNGGGGFFGYGGGCGGEDSAVHSAGSTAGRYGGGGGGADSGGAGDGGDGLVLVLEFK